LKVYYKPNVNAILYGVNNNFSDIIAAAENDV
jgi:hypothetical protein